MVSVSQILREKGGTIFSVTPATKVQDALQLMADKGIGAVLVMEEGEIAGIFSERDYARRVVLKGLSATDTPVGDIMTPRVYFVRPDTNLNDCMILMTERRIRHLPVIDGSQLVGVISIGDVVKSIISEQEYTIDQLISYITGMPAA